MLLVLRLVALLQTLFMLLLGLSLSQGREMSTDAFAGYRVLENGRLVVYVVELSRNLAFDLMDTHCFDKIPPGDLKVIFPDHLPQIIYRLHPDELLATIRRLTCI